MTVPDGQKSIPIEGSPGCAPTRWLGPAKLVRAFPDAYTACQGAAATVVLTEWDEFRWLDFAKVRAAMAAPVVVDARNLLDPAQLRRIGFEYTGHRPAVSRRAGGVGRRRVPRLPPLRPAPGAGRRGGVRRRLLDRAPGQPGPPRRAPGVHPGRGRHLGALPVDGPVDGVFNLASPASPPDYLARPLRPWRSGSEGTRRGLELAQRHGARFLLASTSEVYGDPDVHPQPEELLGQRQPGRPRSVYDEAKRFAEALTMAHHRRARAPTWASPGSSTPTGRGCGPMTAGSSPTSPPGLPGEPLTVYGDGSQTRSLCYVDDQVAGLVALFDSDLTGRSTSATPTSTPSSSWPRTVVELLGSRSPIVHLPLPVDDPTRRRPDITLARTALGWEPTTVLRDGLARTAAFLAEEAGVAPPMPAAVDESRRAATMVETEPVRLRASRPRRPIMADGERAARTRTRPATHRVSLLSVIVPVFNERATVAEVIRRIRAVDLPVDIEVIVVDDGSSDGTDKVLAAVGDSTVRVITHPQNRGKGAAIRTGLDAVRGDLVLVQDADLEYDPDDWSKLLDPILRGKAQVVYGSRFTGERKNMLPLHWIGQPVPLAGHQRPLLVDPLRHGDLLQALRSHGCSTASPSSPTGSTSSRRSPPRSCAAATGSTRCRSPMPDGRSTKARRSPGATGSEP